MAVAGLDIVIAIVVMLSAVIGLVRGLIKEVLSLAAWVFAFAVALYFSDYVALNLPASWGAESVRMVIAFAGLFIASLILAGIVQWLIAKLVETTGLTGTDRFLGFLFGSARGLLVAIVMLMLLREIGSDSEWWQASVLQEQLLAFEGDVRNLLQQAKDLARDVPTPGS
ncbi:MAG: CvpA family protein [bacterium]